MRINNKEDGIVRRLYPGGNIDEYQAKNGLPHGFYRCIYHDGRVVNSLYRDGRKVGELLSLEAANNHTNPYKIPAMAES